VIAELRRRERIANLEWAIETCSKIIERGERAAAARAELLKRLVEDEGA